MRRYSWVRIERKRGATAGSQGTSIDRQRSMATRKSRRNATQAGHASICLRIWSQVRGSTRPSRYSERFENSSGIRRGAARRLPVWPRGFLSTVWRFSASRRRRLSIRLISLRTAESCPMQPDPHRSRLQIENLRNLLGGQLLHVVKHENHAQLEREYARRPGATGDVARHGAGCPRDLPLHPASSRPSSASSGINSSSERVCAGAFALLRRIRQQRFRVTVYSQTARACGS